MIDNIYFRGCFGNAIFRIGGGGNSNVILGCRILTIVEMIYTEYKQSDVKCYTAKHVKPRLDWPDYIPSLPSYSTCSLQISKL